MTTPIVPRAMVGILPNRRFAVECQTEHAMAQRPRRAPPADPFDAVRTVGRAWPDVEATFRYDGSPVLKVGGCFMAGLASHPSAEPGTLVVRMAPEERTWLLEDAPDIYYLTDAYRGHPVVLARLSRLDRSALHDLLAGSRRLTLAKARPGRIARRAFLGAALGASLSPWACSRPAPAGQSSASVSPMLIADLDARIPALMAAAKVPGVSMAIIREGTIAWTGTWGVADAESKRPVDVATVFAAGSISKPVFAYAVMKLCEKGILSLDASLVGYTTNRLPDADAELRLVTARHVLSHTAGFPNWRWASEPLALRFPPGARWSYSGEGYSYLQSIVTYLTGRVAATDIDTFLHTAVLQPFGMADSSYVWTEAYETQAARGHDEAGQPQAWRKTRTVDAARYAAASGLHTTPADYARFLIEVIDPKPADAFRLGPESLREMLRPHVGATSNFGPASWALGWQILHRPEGDIICHGGANPGYQSYAAASVDRRSGFVILTNSDSGYYGLLEPLIMELTFPRLLG
jgi:CubicO group peptidase (beta-lactamase class C family)